MATATLSRPRGRKPRLRVVAADREPTPRHRAYWTHAGQRLAAEIITESEWNAMYPAERPGEQAIHLPDVGYVLLVVVTDDEAEEIEDERQEAVDRWYTKRRLAEA